MSLSTWLLYVAAVLVLTVTPGPSVLMCVSTSVNQGVRKGLTASLGSTTAIVGIMVLSALGLGTALAASETLFTAIKWLGAAYLAYLGIKSLCSSQTDIHVTGSVESSSGRRLFCQGFLVGASNPKALLFFGALFPQFITPEAPQIPQFLVLGTTFVFFRTGMVDHLCVIGLQGQALAAATTSRQTLQPRNWRRISIRRRRAGRQQAKRDLIPPTKQVAAHGDTLSRRMIIPPTYAIVARK